MKTNPKSWWFFSCNQSCGITSTEKEKGRRGFRSGCVAHLSQLNILALKRFPLSPTGSLAGPHKASLQPTEVLMSEFPQRSNKPERITGKCGYEDRDEDFRFHFFFCNAASVTSRNTQHSACLCDIIKICYKQVSSTSNFRGISRHFLAMKQLFSHV